MIFRTLAMLMFVLALGASAEEAPATAPAPAATPAVPHADPGVQDFKGELSIKGLDAKAGVAAIMKVPKADKPDAVEWVDLYAEGELAKKLEDLGDKHAELTVTGVRTAEGIKVSKVGDDVKIPTPKKGKKKK